MARYAQRPKRLTRSYKIERDVIDSINALTQELGVFHSALVNLLLKRAVDEVRAGNWQLEAKPVTFDVAWRE